MRQLIIIVMLLGSFSLAATDSLLGRPAPAWDVTNWLNSHALSLENLRGKVVLVRWWTAPGCRYCAATAPALNESHEQFAKKGLVVVGFYHHKSGDPLESGHVARHARRLGFKFPVATDPEWRTLKHWWLDRGESDWTSVSFLIDRKGIVRHIHPGGEYVKGDSDYRELRTKIEDLLKEEAK